MDRPHEMVLRLSARQEDWLIARMALSGLGMLAGLDADLIGDLQTAVNECCDCLLHQTTTPETLVLSARAEKDGCNSAFPPKGKQDRARRMRWTRRSPAACWKRCCRKSAWKPTSTACTAFAVLWQSRRWLR